MKRTRIVQAVRGDLKGKKTPQQLMDDIKRALRRRGIKEKK